MNFGARVSDALARLEWSALELCDAAVLSEAIVSEIRSGRRSPSLVTALSIAEATGWSIDSLLGDTLGEPDFERASAPVCRVSTGWGDSLRALLEYRSMRALAAACRCEKSNLHAYLRGVEPRLATAIRHSAGLRQQVHAMAIGKPVLTFTTSVGAVAVQP